MRMLRIIFFIIVMAVPCLQAQAPVAAADETAVRALIDKYVNARDARDESVIAGLFTSDADQYTTAGEWRRGRPQVVTGTAESTKQNPGDRSIDVKAVRFVTPDVALVDGWYNIAGSDVQRWTTMVVKRESGTWRISAIRNMVPTGPQGRAGGQGRGVK
jgi:uncharacterized protein (TIGR02246 family)